MPDRCGFYFLILLYVRLPIILMYIQHLFQQYTPEDQKKLLHVTEPQDYKFHPVGFSEPNELNSLNLSYLHNANVSCDYCAYLLSVYLCKDVRFSRYEM